MKEYDTWKDLLSETQASIQGIFNFYITVVTAVLGGIVLILQVPSPIPSDIVRSELIVCGLLFLASIIGNIYLLSIVQRYSRLIVYGQNLDALRLHLIQELDVPMPSIYSRFLGQVTEQTSPSAKMLSSPWLVWLTPTGTYQLAMAFINSCAFSVATWILLSFTGATSARMYGSLVTILVEFFVIFTIYNVYSRIALKYWTSDSTLHLNPHIDGPWRMIR